MSETKILQYCEQLKSNSLNFTSFQRKSIIYTIEDNFQTLSYLILILIIIDVYLTTFIRNGSIFNALKRLQKFSRKSFINYIFMLIIFNVPPISLIPILPAGVVLPCIILIL
jgi:ABC-type Na+ efflux pump permease subunit